MNAMRRTQFSLKSMLWVMAVVSAFLGGYFLGRRDSYINNERAFEMMQREWARLTNLKAQVDHEKRRNTRE
jgi:hypothetical protein